MSLILPVVLALGAVVSTPQQPRDPRPADLSRAAAEERAKTERALESAVAASPDKPELRFKLAKFQEASGEYAAAEATLLAASQAFTTSVEPLKLLAGLYTRTGEFQKSMTALQQIEQMEPTSREHPQRIAVTYWEKAFRDPRVTPEQKRTYIQAGLAATDRALAIDADYADALVYKNILLRMQAQTETDPAQQQQLIAQADALRTRAMELNTRKAAAPSGLPSDAPPPPPPPDGRSTGEMAPVRVGGNIATPTKILDVKPVYPPEAAASRVQGVVILEATIDTAGTVSNARVLRSIPLLDQAAIDAVRQWQFTPTMLNGQPVPVIMTVTVNFTLQ